MEFYRYAFLFLFGGAVGYIIELFFRRFISQKKWVNPGFLTGPLLPLYGFGTIGFYFMCSLPWGDWIPLNWAAAIVEILVIGVLMTLLEYIAGIIFIKGMRIKLWDYSRRWGNIQGIICPLFSAIWLIVGIGYLYLLHPSMVKLSDLVIAEETILVAATVIGFFLGVLTLDFGYSLHLATRIRKAVADSRLVVDWDRIKIYMQDKAKKMKKKAPKLFFFSEKVSSLPATVKEYVDRLKDSPQVKAFYERQKEKEEMRAENVRLQDEKREIRRNKRKSKKDKKNQKQ